MEDFSVRSRKRWAQSVTAKSSSEPGDNSLKRKSLSLKSSLSLFQKSLKPKSSPNKAKADKTPSFEKTSFERKWEKKAFLSQVATMPSLTLKQRKLSQFFIKEKPHALLHTSSKDTEEPSGADVTAAAAEGSAALVAEGATAAAPEGSAALVEEDPTAAAAEGSAALVEEDAVRTTASDSPKDTEALSKDPGEDSALGLGIHDETSILNSPQSKENHGDELLHVDEGLGDSHGLNFPISDNETVPILIANLGDISAADIEEVLCATPNALSLLQTQYLGEDSTEAEDFAEAEVTLPEQDISPVDRFAIGKPFYADEEEEGRASLTQSEATITGQGDVVPAQSSGSQKPRKGLKTNMTPGVPGPSGLQKAGPSGLQKAGPSGLQKPTKGLRTNRTHDPAEYMFSDDSGDSNPMAEYMDMLDEEASRPRKKQPAKERSLRKRQHQTDQSEAEDEAEDETAGDNPPKKKRKHRSPAEEGRSYVQCPYCKKKFYAKLQRHLLTVHKTLVKTKGQADAITKGLKKIPRVQPANETMEEIWGDRLHDPEIRQLVKQTVLASGLEWKDDSEEEETAAGAENQDDEDDTNGSESESGSDMEEGQVRKNKKDMGLNDRVPEDHVVLKEFEKALKKERAAADSIKKTLDRMAQYLAFAEKEDPEKLKYLAVVNVEAGKKYLEKNKQAGARSATRLTYTKGTLKLLQLMNKRRNKMRSVPWTQAGFQEQYDKAVTFWTDKRLKYGRKAIEDRDEKLAKGESVIANLTHCFAYLEDEDVKNKARADLDRIKSFARLRSPLVFKRGDVSDVLAFNSVTRYLMMSLILTNGGPRTGVLQNMRISEFGNADDDGRGNMVVQVRHHKTKESGNAAVVFNPEQHQLVSEFLEVRRKISCAKPSNVDRLFVTTGGLPFRTPHYDINAYMKRKKYPDNISTNSIRKAMETAAANHSSDVQKTVAKRLHHSVTTADANYRISNAEIVVGEHEKVVNVINNERASKYIAANQETLFAGMEEFPSIEELSAAISRELKMVDLELSANVYKKARRCFLAMKNLQP